MLRDQSIKPLEPGDFVAGYRIERTVNRGGFGIVFEAVNPVTKERVAIKQFVPDNLGSWHQGTMIIQDEDAWKTHQSVLERFKTEALLQHTFDHPNILKVKNFVPDGATGYMIADFIDGTTLGKFLGQYGKVFPDEDMFRRLMEPIADALIYVHKQDALHRDISPENIMINKAQKPILVDFGAAKRDLRTSTRYSTLVPYRELYAPIEQRQLASEKPEGRYTDIFALAGTMYHMLAGQPPHPPVERRLSDNDPYVPIAQATKTRCSDAVYRAIDRGLALAPSARPQTMENFLEIMGWRLPGSQPDAPETSHPDVVDPEPDTGSGSGFGQGFGSGSSEELKPPSRVGRILGYLSVALLVGGVGAGLLNSTAPSNPPQVLPSPSPTVSPAPVTVPVPAPPTATPTASPTFAPFPAATAFPAPTPTFRPQPPGYVAYENRDIDGGDLPGFLPHLRDVDQSACESACNNNAECVGYSYGKWDRACYLKGSLPNLRFEPNSTAIVRRNQPRPPDAPGGRRIENTARTFAGSRYSTSNTSSRSSCAELCQRDDFCLGYQYVSPACWRYNKIDFATKDPSAQSGVKRQPPP